MWYLILLIVLGLAVILLASLHFKVRELRCDLTAAQENYYAIRDFISRFAVDANGEEGLDGALNSVAGYVREVICAGSAAIYEVHGENVLPLAISGDYPLMNAGGHLTDGRSRLENARAVPLAGVNAFFRRFIGSGKSELIPLGSVDERLKGIPDSGRIGSVMVVPMLRDGVTFGFVCVVDNRMLAGTSFSGEQLSRLEDLIRRIAFVVAFCSNIRRQERLDQELHFVRQFQNYLVPQEASRMGDFTVSAYTYPAKEVNGDFYDMVRIDDDRMLVMVGDACGKGMPACLLASMTRSFARTVAGNFTTLSDFLKEVNRSLYRDTEADRFVTIGVCLIDRRGNLVEYGRAGHTDMLMHVHNHLRRLSPTGTALGMFEDEDAEFDTICIAVEPGTSLMLFSDGLSEALDNDRNEFGIAKLGEAFKSACSSQQNGEEIIRKIFSEVKDYEYEQTDDQTLMIIRCC